MNKILIILLLPALSACSRANNSKEAKPQQWVQKPMPADSIKDKFSNLKFASNRDTTCKMSLNSGIEDTLMLKGKIYGFCSSECKEEFSQILISQHKR